MIVAVIIIIILVIWMSYYGLIDPLLLIPNIYKNLGPSFFTLPFNPFVPNAPFL